MACGYAARPGGAVPSQAPSSVETFYRDKVHAVGYGAAPQRPLHALLARHIGKHVPGKPTIVPENMPAP
jgi:hypothetical protein